MNVAIQAGRHAALVGVCASVATIACQAPPATDNQRFKAELDAAGLWSGGPEENFEAAGRLTLATMIEFGLQPNDKVLDVGAGSLRVGWWILQYIRPSNYYVIEPVHARIDGALKIIGASDVNVFYNEDFEYPDVKFDFVIARSIWTHASKGMISKMISEFAENSAPDARFLTSYLPASTDADDYMGEEWVGKVENSDDPGMVRHSLAWIGAECRKHGLVVAVQGGLLGQTWLLIGRPNAG